MQEMLLAFCAEVNRAENLCKQWILKKSNQFCTPLVKNKT